MPTLKPLMTGCAAICAAVTLPQSLQAVEFKGIDMHGALSLTTSYSGDYSYLGDTRNSFDLNVVEGIFNAQYRFESGLRLAAQVYAYQLDDYTAIDLDYGNISYSFGPWLNVSVGRNKLPFGLYYDIQDIDMVHPFVFLPWTAVGKDLRAFFAAYDGIGINGTFNLNKAGSLDYKAFAGWRQEIAPEAPAVRAWSSISNLDNVDPGFLYGGSLFYNTPIEGLRFGVSGLFIPKFELSGKIRKKKELPYQANEGRYGAQQADQAFYDGAKALGATQQMLDFLYGPDYSYWDSNIAGTRTHTEIDIKSMKISAEYIKDPFTFAVEYTRQVTDSESPGTPGSTRGVEDGIAFVATWKATSKLEFGAYADFRWTDESDRKGRDVVNLPSHTAYTHDYAVAACYKIKDWWSIKAEYHFVNGTSLVPNSFGQNGDPSDWKKNWNYIALKTTFSF